MWLWQAGLKNVVALMGTYLSYEHIWQLSMSPGTVYVFLDNNMAGRKGTFEAGDKLVKAGSFHVDIMDYPNRLIDDEDAQPDSLTAEEVIEQYADAQCYYAWLTLYIDHHMATME
jgi:DNA primase